MTITQLLSGREREKKKIRGPLMPGSVSSEIGFLACWEGWEGWWQLPRWWVRDRLWSRMPLYSRKYTHTHLGLSQDKEKRPWCRERLKAGGEGGDRGWDGWMASLTQWTWVWASSGRLWRTGKPGVLQSMGSQRVRHYWATEQTTRQGDQQPSPTHLLLVPKSTSTFHLEEDAIFFFSLLD